MNAEARGMSDKPEHVSGQTAEGIRDTIESIVVAFILAFVFRAFVVEAFVIPTGSMAATLNGEHVVHTCTDCGYEYAYGRSRTPDGKLKSDIHPKSACPNCGFLDDVLARENTPPQGGDRILVLKWPYDIGWAWFGPRRWDVTVFKDPADGKTSFIKRMVGLPNEVLQIVDGDIYTAPIEAVDPEVIAKLDRIRHLQYERMLLQQQVDAGQLRDDEASSQRWQINPELAVLQADVLTALDRCLRIQRKTAHITCAQESLWFTVFNQDYLPRRQVEKVGWKSMSSKADSGWDASSPRVHFNGPDRGLETIGLIDSPADVYAYNFDGAPSHRARSVIVRDRRVRCVVTPLAATGRFRMRLRKYTDAFTAELDFDAGTVSLTMESRPAESKAMVTPIGKKQVPLSAGVPVEIALANVDYRASVTLDGVEIITTDDSMYTPNVAALRMRRSVPAGQADTADPIAELDAERTILELRHLVVERDVHYTDVRFGAEYISDRIKGAHNPWAVDSGRGQGDGAPSPGWGTAGNPVLLRQGEYFMLGDNSPESKDSRLWWELGPHLIPRGEAYQMGTVPEDQLTGKAFFVYWPSGLRVPGMQRFPYIPNVGKMRWIR